MPQTLKPDIVLILLKYALHQASDSQLLTFLLAAGMLRSRSRTTGIPPTTSCCQTWRQSCGAGVAQKLGTRVIGQMRGSYKTSLHVSHIKQ